MGTNVYKIPMELDISSIDKQAKKVEGKVKKLKDNQIVLELDIHQDPKRYKKLLTELQKQAPEIAVQVQYDLNKAALDKKLKELGTLKQLDIDLDDGTVNETVQRMVDTIRKGFEKSELSTDELKDKLRELFQYTKTAEKEGWGELFTFDVSSLKDIDEYLKGYVTELDKKTKPLTVANKDIVASIDVMKKDAEYLENILKGLNVTGSFSTITESADDAEAALDRLYEKAKKLDEIEEWLHGNVNRQMNPPSLQFAQTSEEIAEGIEKIREYKDGLDEIAKDKNFVNMSQSMQDEISNTIDYLNRLMDNSQKLYNLATKSELSTFVFDTFGGDQIGKEFEKYFGMLSTKSVKEVTEEIAKDYNLTFDEIEKKWKTTANESADTGVDVVQDAIKKIEQSLGRLYKDLAEMDPKGLLTKYLFGKDGKLLSSDDLAEQINKEYQAMQKKLGSLIESGVRGDELTKVQRTFFERTIKAQANGLLPWDLTQNPKINKLAAEWYKDQEKSFSEWRREYVRNNKRQYNLDMAEDALGGGDAGSYLGQIIRDEKKLASIREDNGQSYVAYLNKVKELNEKIADVESRAEKYRNTGLSGENTPLSAAESQPQIDDIEKISTAIDEVIQEYNELRNAKNAALYEDDADIMSSVSYLERIQNEIAATSLEYSTAQQTWIDQQRDAFKVNTGELDDTLFDVWSRLDDEILNTKMTGEDALASFKQSAKKLGYTFDETANKWIKIEDSATEAGEAFEEAAEKEEKFNQANRETAQSGEATEEAVGGAAEKVEEEGNNAEESAKKKKKLADENERLAETMERVSDSSNTSEPSEKYELALVKDWTQIVHLLHEADIAHRRDTGNYIDQYAALTRIKAAEEYLAAQEAQRIEETAKQKQMLLDVADAAFKADTSQESAKAAQETAKLAQEQQKYELAIIDTANSMDVLAKKAHDAQETAKKDASWKLAQEVATSAFNADTGKGKFNIGDLIADSLTAAYERAIEAQKKYELVVYDDFKEMSKYINHTFDIQRNVSGEAYSEAIREWANDFGIAQTGASNLENKFIDIETVLKGLSGLISDTYVTSFKNIKEFNESLGGLFGDNNKFERTLRNLKLILTTISEIKKNGSFSIWNMEGFSGLTDEEFQKQRSEQFSKIGYSVDWRDTDHGLRGLVTASENAVDSFEDVLRILLNVDSLLEGTGKSLEESENAMSQAEEENRAYAETLEKIYEAQRKADGGSAVDLLSSIHDDISSTADSKATIQSLLDTLSELDNANKYTEDFLANVSELRSKLQELAGQSIISSDQVAELEEAVDKLEEVSKLDVSKNLKEIKRSNYLNQISQYLDKYTGLSLKTRKAIEDIVKAMEKANSAGELKELYDQFIKLSTGAKRAGEETKAAIDVIGSRLKDMDSKFIAQLLSWHDILRYIRQVTSAVTELNTALTEMRKVSDETLYTLQKYQSVSFNLADEVGTTGLQLQQSTADFMRLGESLEDAAESAKTANLLMNVSEFESIDEATESLIAMSAAYKDLDKIDIVNKLNKIGNDYAISTDGIASALQRSASALVTASNDVDEAIALITAGNAVVQDPEKVGNGIRTIALRLTGTKAAVEELEEMGEETEDVITTVSKLRDTILSATKVSKNGFKGFDILDKNGNYKSTYEIMLGLAEIYEDIAETDKKMGTNNLNLLLETIAGKNRANIAASILQNPQILKEAFDDSAINSANSALIENQKYLESIEGHLQKFRNAVQDLYYSLADTGTINAVIDFGTKFINILDAIVEALGPNKSLAATGGLLLFLRNMTKVVPALIRSLPALISGTISLTEALSAIAPTLAAIGTVLTTTPIGPILLAIGAAALAIYGASKLWDALYISVDEATGALADFESKYSDVESKLNDHKKAVENLSDSYFELARGIDSVTGKNISLSSEDYEEFVSTSQELAEMFPQLISGVDEYGNYILDIGDNADEAREKLQSLLEQEKENYNFELYKDLPTVAENAQVLITDAIEKINTAQTELEKSNYLIDTLDKIFEMPDETIQLSNEYAEDVTDNILKLVNEIKKTDKQLAQKLKDTVSDEIIGDEIVRTIQFDQLSTEEKQKLAKYFEQYSAELKSGYSSSIQEASATLKQGQQELSGTWNSVLKNVIGSIEFLSTDDKTAEMLTRFVNSLPAEVAKELDGKDLQKVIAQWVSEAESLSPEDKLRFYDLFDPDMSPEERVQLYNELQSQLPDSLKVYVKYAVADDQDLVGRVNASKNRLATRNTFGAEYVSGEDMAMLDDFFEEMQIDTEEEYEKWLEVTRETENAIDACDAYRKAVAKAVDESEDLPSTILDSVEGINKRLKSQFDELGSLYKGIFYNDKGFSLADIDNEQLAALKKAFIDLEDEHGNKIGASFKGGEEAVNKFIDTLTSAETKSLSVAQQQKVVQKAFNDLATAYFYSADGLKELNDETKDALAQQFSKMGITNADEVIDNAINTRKKLDELITVEDNPNVSAVDDIKEAVAYSEEYVDELDDIYKQYNAINNVDRDLIIWDDENLEKYKDFLTDFYDGDYEAAVKDLKDTWSTVLGTAEEFNGIQIAYTQMLQTDHGLVPLTSEQFSSYFNSIIQKATNKDGTIDADKLVKLDTEGVEMEINGQVEKVYGLIAAAEGQHMGEIQLTADDVIAIGGGELADNVDSIFKGFSMHDVQANALFGDYKQQLSDLEAARERLEEQGKTLEEITQSDITALLEEGTISEQTARQLEYYVAAKAASNGNLINTDVSCEALYALAKEAGLAAAELEVLNEIMGMFDQALAYEEKGAYQAANAIRNEANARLDRVKQLIQEKVNENLDIDFSVPKDDAKNGGKEAADAYVEAYKKEKEKLQSDRDAGLISESEYLEKLKVLIDKFFKDRAKYAKNYIDEMKEYLDGMKSLYDSAISGVTTLIDKKIDAANKSKDAAISALEKEKEAAEEAYQAQIDALQAQIDKKQELIDKINEANEARDHEMALQKAQYELERSLNQRTRLVYTGEVGQMRYERDESAVREAREGVQDAEDQLAIDALEKEIKLLEKQKEAIEKTMEATSKYYEKLIKQQEEYWDTLIEGLEKQKSKWEELAEIETIANAYSAIEQVFGPLGYSVEEVINGSEAAFEDFKNKYIDLLKEMNSGNKPFLEGVDYAATTYQKSIGEISKSSAEMKDTLQKVSDATTPLSTAADNVKAVGDAAQTASSGVGALKTSSEGISENLASLKEVDLTNISLAFKGLSETLDKIKEKIVGADSIQSAIQAINNPVLLTGLAQAFTTLGNAVGVAAAAIGGGGADAEEVYGGAGQHGKNGMPSNISASSVSGGTGEGLVGAINSVKTATAGSIGTSAEDAEGTAIGSFNLLGEAIDATTKKVGSEDEDEISLIGTITEMPSLTEEPINNVISQFDLLLAKIAEVAAAVAEVAAAIASLSVPDVGGGGGGGVVLQAVQYTGTAQGNSKASGDWGVKRDQTALVGELGQELLLRDGTYQTIGDHGPEFVKLHKDDVILNHKQTKEILSKRNHVRGISMADGTVLSPLSSSSLAMQSKIQNALANVVPSLEGIQKIVNQQTKELVSSNKQTSTPNINITNPQFTVSGVSGEDVMREIEGAFEGLMLNAYQKAMSQ